MTPPAGAAAGAPAPAAGAAAAAGLGRVLLHFGAAYVLLVLAAGIVLPMFGWRANPGVQAGLMLGAVLWSCLRFSQRHGRTLTPPERRRAVSGMVAIDIALQLLWLAFTQPSAVAEHPGVFAGLFLLITGMHATAIWFTAAWAGRLHLQQLARQQARQHRQ